MVVVALLPGVQGDLGNGDGVAWHEGVAENKRSIKSRCGGAVKAQRTHIKEGFLNANGCMSLIASPLSQWTRARLDFLISINCSSVNLPGLAELS